VTKKRIKRLVVPVPQNLDEAAKFLSSISESQREINQIKATLNKAVEELTAQAIKVAKPHQDKKDQLVEGLFVFAMGRRDDLPEKGKRKTVKLPTGWFGWRITPPKVNISKTKTVIAALKRLKLKRFIRVTEEVNKEAMLNEPGKIKKVPGVSITQQEEFVIKPLELEIEIVAKKKTKIPLT